MWTWMKRRFGSGGGGGDDGIFGGGSIGVSSVLLLIFGVIILLVQTPATSGVRTLTSATKFDDYITVLDSLPTFVTKLRVIEAVWAEIRADHGKDVQKTSSLYYYLNEMLNDAEKLDRVQEQAARQLLETMRQEVVQLNTQLLSKIFVSDQHYIFGDDLNYVCQYLLPQHSSELATTIFSAALDHVYSLQSPTVLAAHLHAILNDCPSVAFSTITEAQLYLFRKFLSRGEVNDVYLFNLAYYLKELQEHPIFKEQKNTLRRRLEMDIKSLPGSLQHLFFRPNGYCLLNRKYEEFIYTTYTIPIDEQNIYIFTWKEPFKVKGNGPWLSHITKQDDDGVPGLNVQFALQSKLTRNFMYVAPKLHDFENIVASWVGGKPRSGSYWNVQLMDQHLVFSQSDGRILCSHDSSYSIERRYVFASTGNMFKATEPNCQWLARECPPY